MRTHPMYFIPIIASALREKDSRMSLEKAFRRIQDMGESPPYSHGHNQFSRFMVEAAHAPSALLPSPQPTVFLKKDGREIGSLRLSKTCISQSFDSIAPGRYALVLETGWTLWEKRLEERHVRWSMAFPGRAFDLAAATEKLDEQNTLFEEILGGALSVRITPGPETGCLNVSARPFEE